MGTNDVSAGREDSGAVFDPNTETLYLSHHIVSNLGIAFECGIQVIDTKVTKQWTVKDCLVPERRDGTLINCERLVLIGGELHTWEDHGQDMYTHCVLNKDTGEENQDIFEELPDSSVVTRTIFVASRGSIVTFSQSHTNGGTKIVEYSLTTKQCEFWEWAHPFLKDYFNRSGSFVAVMNGRYILSFGGSMRKEKVFTQIDSIMIYDVEKKQCVESELKLPVTSDYWQPVLMTNQNRDEMLTFGFIKRCYKAEKFRNMLILPTPLITLIEKYIAMEFVHLILAKDGRGSHYRINVDDILN